MSKLILVLGGSAWQLGIIHRARELGHRILVADISADAPGHRVADLFVQVDTNDRLRLIEIARQYQVDLVIAEQTDRTVPVAAFINETLGLNGIPPAVAERFTNKAVMRAALDGAGVSMPRYREVETLAETKSTADEIGYPVVLKPKESQSSIGVFRVMDELELERCFAAAMHQSRDGRILVEEFVDGPEVTVEGITVAGVTHVLAVSEKEHYAFNPCVAKRLVYPPALPTEVLQRVRRAAERVVATLGLRTGINHAEYRVRNGVPYLVEVAARGGGNGIASIIVPHVSGIDLYDVLLRSLLGEYVDVKPVRPERAAALEFFDFSPGEVTAIDGVDEARRDERIRDLRLHFAPGDLILEPGDDKSRLGYFIALGRDRRDVEEVSAQVRELVRVRYSHAVRSA